MADTDWLGRLTGAADEAKQRFKSDAEQRRQAAKEPRSIILNQKDVLTGNWDASKVLFTTIGGVLRPITLEDLRTFKYNIGVVKSQFKKGITAKQVIDLSWHDDRKRASEEIKQAVPLSFSNGIVKFITNAGGTTPGVTRHHVVVEFLGYSVEAASGNTTAKQSANRLKNGRLKFDCDCGRHRYWFRYIATIGGYNAGRKETGYPKIRNPKLGGIACKHVLRVMAEIDNGPMILSFLTKAMEKAKASDEANAAARFNQKDAENLAKGQAKRADSTIKTSDQKKARRSRRQDTTPTRTRRTTKAKNQRKGKGRA
ncbi:hypothetical protein [Methylocucumis oryzae]|uniref:hypothetical protein n=1 Tax=Methylocucumis oryzae TaxID=1632867 RepID=UPI000698CA8F|nr:hypothetical protein [Methylocucumis oryzae]